MMKRLMAVAALVTVLWGGTAAVATASSSVRVAEPTICIESKEISLRLCI